MGLIDRLKEMFGGGGDADESAPPMSVDPQAPEPPAQPQPPTPPAPESPPPPSQDPPPGG